MTKFLHTIKTQRCGKMSFFGCRANTEILQNVSFCTPYNRDVTKCRTNQSVKQSKMCLCILIIVELIFQSYGQEQRGMNPVAMTHQSSERIFAEP